ncbi:MAG: gliding motility-associated C-terminal domain-containing protein, partial [Bacteroidales bacterium]|nr:gliding motility-associated C-terminal domain-containing protein [Bacteroidales bacterium]
NTMVGDHLYIQDGQYTLSATIWGPPGCIDPAGEEHQIQVEVLNKPEIMVSPDYQLVCENYNARITASGADFYVGYDDLGTELLFDKDILSLQPADTTQIQIVGTTDEGCKDTCQALIDVERMPYFTLGNDTCLKVNEQIELSTQNPGVTSHWNTGDSTSTLLVTEPSMESICVTLIPEVCPSITDCIFIDYCPLIDLPSAFSPNGDGVNDRLRIMYHQIQAIDFKIYSRWGKLVYHSHSLAEGWDGTFEGIPQVMEVYLYTIEAITNAGEVIQKTGNISLLR